MKELDKSKKQTERTTLYQRRVNIRDTNYPKEETYKKAYDT